MYSVSYYKIMVFHISDIVWERFRLVYDTVKFLNDITPLKDWITPGSQLLQGAAKVVLVVSPGRLDSLYRRHKLNKTCGCLKGVKEAIPRCPWQAQLSKDTPHTHTTHSHEGRNHSSNKVKALAHAKEVFSIWLWCWWRYPQAHCSTGQ